MSRRILSVRLLGLFFTGAVVIGREWQLLSIHREQGKMLLNVPLSLNSSYRQR